MHMSFFAIVASVLAGYGCAAAHIERSSSRIGLGDRNDASSIYKPINVLTSRDTGSIEVRDTTRFTNIDPADRVRMVFGKVGDKQTIRLADMTLYADPNMPIVMMEAFEGLTSAVDCDGNDGRISLTFQSTDAFNYAIKSWSYINEVTDRQFLMIANHDGCGPADERQSYRITDVDNDEANNTVFLNSTLANWNEVAGTFDMSFGKINVPPSTMRSLRARGLKDLLDKTKDGFDDVADKIKGIGGGDLSESVTIPFSVGEKGVTKLLFEDFTKNPPRLKLSCTDCFAEASFATTGSVKVENFQPSSLLLEIEPQDLRATIQLQAEVSQTAPGLDIFNFDQPIFEAAIPGAGIVVPNIFTLGAKAAFSIQGNAEVSGTAIFTFGAKSSLPNGSKISLDLVDFDNSKVTSFDNVEVDPIFDFDNASITANIMAGPQIALTLGVEVLDNTGIEAGLTFGVPTINLNATAGFDENGFCSTGDALPSGVKVVSAANFDMVLAIKSQSNSIDNSLFDRKLVDIPIATFLDKCFPISGIEPSKPTASSS
ncbi:hypothetical protein GX48_02945 [Paracoccidioides brasiliensis]|nr:hypothetical protein GX48_02945 [Paracoccidioides brasiliensis]